MSERAKKFRQKNKKYRNDCRKRNYKNNRPEPEIKKRRESGVAHRPWTEKELDILLYPEFYTNSGFALSDKDIARELNRSVQSIQQKRYLIRKDWKCQEKKNS